MTTPTPHTDSTPTFSTIGMIRSPRRLRRRGMLLAKLGRLPVVTVAVVVGSLAAAGCGGSSKSPTTTAPAGSGGATSGAITIKSFKFSPNPLQAKVGDTITITNSDSTNHTATANDGSFDTGGFQGTKTFTVSKAGTIQYHCSIHTYMTGSIQVSD